MAAAARGHILLTLDDIEAWRQEQHDIDQMIEELMARGKAIDRKLEAASILMEDMVQGLIPGKPEVVEEAKRPSPETGAEERRLRSPAPMPLLVQQAFADGSRLSAGEVARLIIQLEGVGGPTDLIKNNVYTALKRLVERGRLERDEYGIYSRSTKAEESLNGEAVSDSEASEDHHSSLMFNPQPIPAG